MSASVSIDQLEPQTEDFLSFKIADHVFGIPVSLIQDIFMPECLTSVPLADDAVAGVLNLRGTIVTMVNAHTILGLDAETDTSAQMAIRLEYEGESYGVIVDSVGDVLSLNNDLCEENPSHLDPTWSALSSRVYRLENALMVVLDVFELLKYAPEKSGA